MEQTKDFPEYKCRIHPRSKIFGVYDKENSGYHIHCKTGKHRFAGLKYIMALDVKRKR